MSGDGTDAQAVQDLEEKLKQPVKLMGGNAKAALKYLKKRWGVEVVLGGPKKNVPPEMIVVTGMSDVETWSKRGPAAGDDTMYELVGREKQKP